MDDDIVSQLRDAAEVSGHGTSVLHKLAAARIEELEEMIYGPKLEHSTARLSEVHGLGSCAGDFCTIHNRSNHNMRSFPQHWRADRGIMERICPHGVGHPDPDSPWEFDSYMWIHGCDGCCGTTETVNK